MFLIRNQTVEDPPTSRPLHVLFLIDHKPWRANRLVVHLARTFHIAVQEMSRNRNCPPPELPSWSRYPQTCSTTIGDYWGGWSSCRANQSPRLCLMMTLQAPGPRSGAATCRQAALIHHTCTRRSILRDIQRFCGSDDPKSPADHHFLATIQNSHDQQSAASMISHIMVSSSRQ